MHTVYTINKKNKQMVIGLVREYFESNGFEIYKFQNHKLHFIKKINSNKRYPRIHFKIIITSKGLSVWSHIDFQEHSNCVIGYHKEILEIDIKLRKYLLKKIKIKYFPYKEKKDYKKEKIKKQAERACFCFLKNNSTKLYLIRYNYIRINNINK